MAEQSDGCHGETLLALCARKKTLQRKMTKDYHWIGGEENNGMFSKSLNDFILSYLIIYLSLKDKLGLYSMNCHNHAMTVNCSASLRVLAASGFCDDRKSALR